MLCNSYMRTHVNNTEAMYKVSRVNVKVERGSTFTFICLWPFIHCLNFQVIYARNVCSRTHLKITRQWKSFLKATRFSVNFQKCKWGGENKNDL